MNPLSIINGSFYRDGEKILPSGPVYFGRTPGTCGGSYFADPHWKDNEAWMERDFALMRQVGFSWAIPFVNSGDFWREGKPVEEYFTRVARMIELARQNDLYLILFPNIDPPAWPAIMGRRDPEADVYRSRGHIAISKYAFEASTKNYLEFALRFGNDPVIPLWLDEVGSRLWTGYAGFRPGEPEAAELLPVKPFWQQWLRKEYADDFAEYLRKNPLLPEQPRSWDEVLLPTEVTGQFTPADSRTFDFLRYQSQTSVATKRRFYQEIHKYVPQIKKVAGAEGCEFCTGPEETYLPGLGEYDAVWIEMYGFNMAYGSHVAPNWQRVGYHEPTTGKAQIDSLSVCSEAWERCRYLKAAAPNTALIPCHGSVMQAFLRWAFGEREQRILFERLQRIYQEAGADGLGFWCWTDDDSSARPEPEYFHREGETMGVIDLQGRYRPVARRMRTYLSAKVSEPRVSTDVLLLVPTASRLGLPQIDSNMTVACLTSALARLGIQPEVKHTFFQGKAPIPLEEITPYKVVVVAVDEYNRDFSEVPETLLQFVKQGGQLLLALGDSISSLLSPRGERQENPALAELLGSPEIEATYHQHFNPWTVSLRWQLRDDFLPYWDPRRGRYLPGRHEKELTFKWLRLPADAQLLAEAVAPAPYKGDDPAEMNKYFIQQQKVSPWSPLLYKRKIGKGEVYIFCYSLNVFRSWLDEMDYQRDDWDWVLQAPLDAAHVSTDPTGALSMLAQEFMNFRPTP